MDERGLGAGKILAEIASKARKDAAYASGKVLSSMCTVPNSFSKRVYTEFMETNLGDAGLFPGTREMEEEAVRMLGRLLHREGASGFILPGGTEANITALWIARNRAKKRRGRVVISEAGHFSFRKAADLLGLRLDAARENDDHSVSIEDAQSKITKDTIAIVGIAGSTEYGSIDDIAALGELAEDRGIYLHVDAAFGGFVLPFMKELGYKIREFDFAVEAVSSMTIDPHKMGLAPIPSGGLILRDAKLLEYIETESPYLLEKRQYTLSGTRCGASAAATYAVMRSLGRRSYRENVKRCMENTMLLYEGLKDMGLKVNKPPMNILTFDHKHRDRLAERLMESGWFISRTRRGEIRLVIMPHVKKEDARAFLRNLKRVLKEL